MYMFTEEILHDLVAKIQNKLPIENDMTCGKLGQAVLLLWYADRYAKPDYVELAKYLVNESVNCFVDQPDLMSFSNISELGIGLIYIYKKGYLEFNQEIDRILKPIDDIIFKHCNNQNYLLKQSSLLPLYYLSERYELIKSKSQRKLFYLLVNDIINNLSLLIEHRDNKKTNVYNIELDDFPFLLYIIRRLFKMDVNNDKILKILNVYSNDLLTYFPLFQQQRIFYLWGISNIKIISHDYRFEAHIEQLIDMISIEQLRNEIIISNPYFKTGIASTMFFIKELKELLSIEKLDSIQILLSEQLKNSFIWNKLKNSDIYFEANSGLISGFGIIVMLLDCK